MAEGESDRLPLAVLISGEGTNLQAIIDAIRRGDLRARIRAVISSRADAHGLVRAQRAGIPGHVLRPRDFADSADFDQALASLIDRQSVRLIVLAGFMRILGAAFVDHFRERIVNIHPSLLPKYRGLNTHARAIADGAREHGASVHYVTSDLDSGPVIIQARVPVLETDTPATLQLRVHEVEHRILPQALQWIAEDRLSISDGRVLLDGKQRPEQGLIY